MGVYRLFGPDDQPYAFQIAGAKPTDEDRERVQAFFATLPPPEPVAPPPPPPPKRGFFDPVKGSAVDLAGKFGAGWKGGIGSLLGDDAAVAQATADAEATEKRVREINPLPNTFKDVREKFANEGIMAGLGSLPGFVNDAIQGSVPWMVAPIAAGRTAFALTPPVLPFVGPLAKPIAAGLAAVGAGAAQFFPANIVDQIEAQKEAGQTPTAESLSPAKAGFGAVLQGSLDALGPLASGLLGRAASREVGAAMQGVGRETAKGVGKGIAAEVPTEIAQDVIARAQAGRDLTSQEALDQYMEAGAGAFFIGGGMGGGSGALGARANNRAYAERVEAEQARARLLDERLRAAAEERQAAELAAAQNRIPAEAQALNETLALPPPSTPPPLLLTHQQEGPQGETAGRPDRSEANNFPVNGVVLPDGSPVATDNTLSVGNRDQGVSPGVAEKSALQARIASLEADGPFRVGSGPAGQFTVANAETGYAVGDYATAPEALATAQVLNQYQREDAQAAAQAAPGAAPRFPRGADAFQQAVAARQAQIATWLQAGPQTEPVPVITDRPANVRPAPKGVLPSELPQGTRTDYQVVERPVAGQGWTVSVDGKRDNSFTGNRREAGERAVALKETNPEADVRPVPSKGNKNPSGTAFAVMQRSLASTPEDPAQVLGMAPISTHATRAEAEAALAALQPTVTDQTRPTRAVISDATQFTDEVQPVARYELPGIPIRRAGGPDPRPAPKPPEPEDPARVAFRKRVEVIGRDLRRRLSGVGLDDIKLKLANVMRDNAGNIDTGIEGDYFRKVITLAVDRLDPNMTEAEQIKALAEVMDHEIIHALKALKLFTDREWVALTKAAERAGLLDAARETYPNDTLEVQREESVAELFRMWSIDPRSVTGQPRGLLNRIRMFFARLADALRGHNVQSADEILGRVRFGEIGNRPREASRTASAGGGATSAPAPRDGGEIPRPQPARTGRMPNSERPRGAAPTSATAATDDEVQGPPEPEQGPPEPEQGPPEPEQGPPEPEQGPPPPGPLVGTPAQMQAIEDAENEFGALIRANMELFRQNRSPEEQARLLERAEAVHARLNLLRREVASSRAADAAEAETQGSPQAEQGQPDAPPPLRQWTPYERAAAGMATYVQTRAGPLDPGSVSKKLSTDLPTARRLLELMAAEGRIIAARNGLFRHRPRRIMSLLDFLISHGGVIDEGGELKSRDGHLRSNLIKEDGITLQRAYDLAAEERYPVGGEINDLLEAIDEELHGDKKYSAYDTDAVAARDERATRAEDRDRMRQARDQIEEVAKEENLSVSLEETEAAISYVMSGEYDAHEALHEAIQDSSAGMSEEYSASANEAPTLEDVPLGDEYETNSATDDRASEEDPFDFPDDNRSSDEGRGDPTGGRDGEADPNDPEDDDRRFKRAHPSTRLVRGVDKLIKAAEEQAHWRDWYERYKGVVQDLFGTDAVLFRDILSAVSQANTVAGNVTLALKAYRQMKAGEPFTGYLEAVIKNLDRVRAKEEMQGAKISAYAKANAGDTDAMAIDRHIAMMLFNRKTPNKGQIIKAKDTLRKVASRLGWTPREAQSTLWAANQVRLGTPTEKVKSYDTLLLARAKEIETLIRAFRPQEDDPGGSGRRASPGGDAVQAGEGGNRAGGSPEGAASEDVDRRFKRAAQATNTTVPEFAKWFRRSVVVDDQGRPLVMYHGTSKGGFEAFDPKKTDAGSLYGPGFYFTDNVDVAGSDGGGKDWREIVERAKSNATGYAFQRLELKPIAAAQGVTEKNLADIEAFYGGNLPTYHYYTLEEQIADLRNQLGVVSDGEKAVQIREERLAYWKDKFDTTKGREDRSEAGVKIQLLKNSVEDDRFALRAAKADLGRQSQNFLNALPPDAAEKVFGNTFEVNGNPTVYPVYLSIQNPFDMDAYLTREQASEIFDRLDAAAAKRRQPDPFKRDPLKGIDLAAARAHVEKNGGRLNGAYVWKALSDFHDDLKVGANQLLQIAGYDGITHTGGKIRGTHGEHRVYIAFAPEQIKSVFNKFEEGASTDRRFKLAARNAGTSSPDFAKWFGDSKAVNPDGTPQVYYHGSPKPFRVNEFKGGKSGNHWMKDWEGPFFFSPDTEFANDYALSDNSAGGQGKTATRGTVYPVYLSVRNPFDPENEGHIDLLADALGEAGVGQNKIEQIRRGLTGARIGNWSTLEQKPVQAAIRAAGFDGFFVKEAGVRNLAVFNAKQVKSVFNPFEPGVERDRRFKRAAEETNESLAEFAEWWRDSKVVDANGFPLRMFHGTSKGGFTYFDKEKANRLGLFGPGFYFTSDPNVAGGGGGATNWDEVASNARAKVAGYAFQGMTFRLGLNEAIAQKLAAALQGKYEYERDPALWAKSKQLVYATAVSSVRRWQENQEKQAEVRDYIATAEAGLAKIEADLATAQKKRDRFEIDLIKSFYLPTAKSRVDLGREQLEYWKERKPALESEVGERMPAVILKDLGITSEPVGAPTIYPVYLSIQNPLDMDQILELSDLNRVQAAVEAAAKKAGIDFEGGIRPIIRSAGEFAKDKRQPLRWSDVYNALVRKARHTPSESSAKVMLQKILQAMGHDGIAHEGGIRVGTMGRHKVFIAFEPEQVKSVFNKFEPGAATDRRLSRRAPISWTYKDGKMAVFKTEEEATEIAQALGITRPPFDGDEGYLVYDQAGRKALSDTGVLNKHPIIGPIIEKHRVEPDPFMFWSESAVRHWRAKQMRRFALTSQGTAQKQLDIVYSQTTDRIARLLGKAVGKEKGQKAANFLVDKMADKMMSVGQMLDDIKANGGTIYDGMDPYMREELYRGRVLTGIEEREKTLYKPLLDRMKTLGVTPEDLGEYLYARHAPERNDYVASINPNRPDYQSAGSGMSDDEAARIVASASPAVKSLAAGVDAIISNTNATRVAAGLIPVEVAQDQTFQHYVPLRGYADENLYGDEGIGEIRARAGKAFGARGREDRSITGRRSEAGRILEHVLLQNEEAVIRAEKNRVGQAFLDLVESGEGNIRDYAEVIERAPMKAVKTPTGVRLVPHGLYKSDPDVVTVKRDGKEIAIRVADPRVAKALGGVTGLGSESVGYVLRHMGMVNQYLARLNTGWNPEFVFSNFPRDLQTAAINSQQYDIPGLTKKIVSDLPKALAGIKGFIRDGKIEGEWGKAYADFRKLGGTTAYYGLRDLQSQIDKVSSALSDKKPGARMLQPIRSLGKFIEDYNEIVENGVRVTTFENLRRAGVSDERAAQAAKNLTVNFNKGGEARGFANSLYLFYNASIQGSFAMANAITKSKRVRNIVGGVVVAGLMQDIINSMISGDDDDGKKLYDRLPPYLLEHNLILMDPFGISAKGYFAFPMPYGFNAFYNLGRTMGRSARGEYTPWEAASTGIMAFVDAFNPLGGTSSFLNFAAPTILDPIVDLRANTDFANRPISPEGSPFAPQPASSRYWNNTNPAYVNIARWLADLGGGTPMIPGHIEISPNTMQYMVKYATGGLGAFVERLGGLAFSTVPDALRGDLQELEIRDIPIVRKLYGNVTSRNAQEDFIERRNKVLAAAGELRQAKELGDEERIRYVTDKYADELSIADPMKKIVSRRQKLSTELQKIERSEHVSDDEKRDIRKAYKESLDALVIQANRLYAEVVEKRTL